jgi:autotransporter-associated beta strand protein
LADRAIVNNGLLVYNSTTPTVMSSFNSIISGTGNVIVHTGTLKAYAGPGNTYTGWTQIDPGATLQFVDGNGGASTSSVITNNGTLYFTAQEFVPAARGYSNNIVGTGRVLKDNNNANPGWIVLAGTNSYTGGTFIAGGGVQLGDGINVGSGAITGNVVFTNTAGANFLTRTLIFMYADSSVLFPGNITSVVTDSSVANSGALLLLTNKVILTGNNTYPGGTTISNSTSILQVGNGGTTGSIGSGGVVNEGTLVFDRSDNITITNVIANGLTPGAVVQIGSGAVTLTGANTYTGATTVSNGILAAATAGGAVNVSGGTLVAGTVGTVSTLTVTGALSITSGTVQVSLNKSLLQSNSLFSAASITASGGTLGLVNLGPTLTVGDKFTVFNQAVTGGASMAVTLPGYTFANNLAVDGSITVTGAPVSSPTLNYTKIGSSSLQFSWSGGGFKLQAQTNSITVGLRTNWADYPGGGSSPVTVPIDITKGTVFFRLISTP